MTAPPALRPYQERAIAEARAACMRGARAPLIVSPTGSGKCLGIGTPVMQFDGTIVPVEDVRTGDLLMGPDSKPRRVLSTARGRGRLYRITPVKGNTWICNDVHVLTLVHTVTGEIVDIDLQTYLSESNYWRHCHKLFMPPNGVDFQGSTKLPIDPYFLGVWFGDGTKRLAGVSVTKPDPEIEALVHETARAYGLRVRTWCEDGKCPTHHIVGERGAGNPLLATLRRVLDGNPYVIPHTYQTANRADREAFLAGVLDTDGHLGNGVFEVVQKHLGIAEGIAFIARSLGIRVTESAKLVNGESYIRMCLSGDFSQLPIRIPRKQASPRRQKKSVARTGLSVSAIGFGEYAGFELDDDGRFLLGDFTVTHNTVIGSDIARSHVVAGGAGVLWLAHRRELIDQAADALELRTGLTVGVIAASETRRVNPYARIQVASVQTLRRRTELPKASLVVFDECVTAGTLIDGRPVETIKAGDFVSSFDRVTRTIVRRRVVRTFCNTPGDFLVRVHIAGRMITCTPNHPFLIRRGQNEGYIEAGNLEPGDLCGVRQDVPADDRPQAQDMRCACVQDRTVARADARSRGAAKDLARPSCEGDRSQDPRGERQWAESVRSPARAGDGAPTERDCSDWTTEQGPSDTLQNRSWRSRSDACDRSGRTEPFLSRPESAGREEGGVFDWSRVDRIEVFKRGCDPEFGQLCPDNRVYNLEVEGTHTYLAEGVIVHNCHHMVSDDWIKLARAYDDAVRVGLSATPERGDGQGLGAIFDAIVVAASPSELTALGYLVPCTVVAPDRPLRAAEIAQRPIDAYLEHARGRRTILFAAHRRAAREYLEEFRAAGVRADFVHGDLPAGERAETLDRYRSGAVDVLINVNVLTEGFDDPATACCIIARGCTTPGMYLQMVGRILRPAPGKVDALLLDLRGVVHVHGRPEEERFYSLDGRAICRGGDIAEARLCVVCQAVIPAGSSICPDCERAPSELTAPKVLGLELVRFAGKRLERDDQRVATLARWFRDARYKGFQLGWAYHKYKVVYGDWPPPDVKRAANDQLRRIA